MKPVRQLNIPIGQIKCFVVTGRYYNSNRRFRSRYDSYQWAMMVNLWNGSVWAELDSGKRVLLKRVYN